jgi:hypothetical protein
MATIQGTNNSNTGNLNSGIPVWLSQSWRMTTNSGNVVSNTVSYSVTFDTSNPLDVTIALYGTTWGHLDSTSVTVAASSSAATTTIIGTTIFGQPFHIDHTDGMLKCYLEESTSPRRWLAVGLGVIAGTLLGGAVGFAAGALLIGVTSGLVAATTCLLVARGAASPNFVQDGGSTPIWTADDGRKGTPGGDPGGQGTRPHSLKAVGA